MGGYSVWLLSRRAPRTERGLSLMTDLYLVTGGSGQVGGAFTRTATAQGIDLYAPDRRQLDLTNKDSIVSTIASRPWSAVINCAAYTAVDKAEAQFELAQEVNARAPAIMAEETARLNIPLIHVSTDYVFDGTKTSPYTENDVVNPLGVYGRTKEAGEAAIRASGTRYAIIRTAWILSAGGANFLNTMLQLGAERSEMKVVNDQVGCPTNANDVANTLLKVAQKLGDRCGTWHFVNSGEASWYDLADYIYSETRKRGLVTPRLVPISTVDYPTPAKRPANSRLETAALIRDFSIVPRPWQEAVSEILSDRLTQ